MAFGVWTLAARRSARREARSLPLLGRALVIVLGVALVLAAALLLAGISQGRLLSVEAGVLFGGWVAAHLAFAGVRHWLQPTALALAVAIVVLALLLPCPG
jgi:hypothetical protein